MIAAPEWEQVTSEAGLVPESARWYASEGFFQWTDIRRQTVSRWARGRPVVTVAVDDLACAALPCRDGGTVFVGRSTLSRLDVVTGQRQVFHDFGLDDDMRLNDATADPKGRLWVGSRAAGGDLLRGRLYRVDPDGTVHEELGDVLLSNGICWTADGSVAYYADFRARRIDRLGFDDDGHVASREELAGFEDLRPDGLTVDARGNVWVALWENEIRALDPDGETVARWPSPARQPTSVAFGGPGLDQLLVTTAAGREAPPPRPGGVDGQVFVARTGLEGVPPFLLAF